MKKFCGLCAFFTLISMLIVACSGGAGTVPSSPGAPSNNVVTPTPTSPGNVITPTPSAVSGTTGNTVGMASTNFAQSSITIKKGESITLQNQTATVHLISNGSWNGNTPEPKAEPGAPVVNNLMFNTNNESKTIGPFDQTGTFHYYCTVHPGMNLTVTVQ